MLNVGAALATFIAAEMLGAAALIAGGVVLYWGFTTEDLAVSITGGWLLGGSLACFIVAQIGRAVVQIAENSAEMLDLLDNSGAEAED